MFNAVLRRGGEVLAATLVVAFVSLRCMELVDVYCQSGMHLVLHAGLAALAALRPGLPRVTLLSVLYGVMRHRLDVQVYVAPEAASLAGAIVVIAGASSGRLCRKQGPYGRPVPPQPADRPRLVKAPGSLRHALALREATGEPGGRSLRHLAFNTGGIGLALAHEVAALDAATIVLGCRNLSKCELVRPVGARCVQLDLADLRSVVQFAGELLCQKRGPPRFGQN
jgi:predicted thioesterase